MNLQTVGVVLAVMMFAPLAGNGSQKASESPCYSIAAKYRSYGGANGILGKPTVGEAELADNVRGRYQHFRGAIFGPHGTSVSVKMPEHVGPPPTSAHPEHGQQIPVESSIYWTPTTCAHVVQGDIRSLWLSMGAQQGPLGYPLSDEMDTPDGRGRMSRFERGEIWWYPETGAAIRSQ